MKGKVLGLLALVGAGIYAVTRKSDDGGGGGGGGGGDDGTIVLTYDEIKEGPEQILDVTTDDVLVVELPGLVEQWSLEVSGGGGQALDDIMGITRAGERGVVVYRFTIEEADAWAGRIVFKLNGTPDADLQLRYSP